MNTNLSLPRGAVMADVAGFVLTDEERIRLSNPAIGGVILFRRNFESVTQLKKLTAEIHAIRRPPLVIAVDHEGGRVQRFIEGFTRLPAMNVLGEIWEQEDQDTALKMAKTVGWVLAAELRACGVDLSFTPVLDLAWGNNQVIGNRSFHADAKVVSKLALALQDGLNKGGMASCGKHFPGHGFVGGDSHYVLPEDDRSLERLLQQDILPFKNMSVQKMAAVMPAHVVYPKVCAQAAGFSKIWLQDILRKQVGFTGVIFSDDLTMEGAVSAGSISERAEAAFAAGCDIVLVCNRPDLVDELLVNFRQPLSPELATYWENMAGKGSASDFERLLNQVEFQVAQAAVAALSSPKDTAFGVKVGEHF